MATRLFIPFSAALFVTLSLFLLMSWMIRPPSGPGHSASPNIDSVEMVDMKKQQQDEDQAPEPPQPTAAPSSPAALATPQLPQMSAMTALPFDASVSVPVNLGGSGFGVGTGAFKGFAHGSGSGSGGGAGAGQGFSGKELIPLSTARPQMPEWACKQNIKGWVEAVFLVMPNGHVRDVKIIDASPKGVYEAAAVESISNWIYAEYSKAREVKQRVPMDPADCAYNWR